MRKTEMRKMQQVMICKKNPKTDGYDKDRSLRSENYQTKKRTRTKTRKQTKTKNCSQVK